jgi:hypothetical protein
MKTTAILFSLFCLSSVFAEDTPAKQADNEALAQAIVSSNWSWENSAGGTKSLEEIQFYQGGFAENSRSWTARWEIAGPRILVIENTKRGARHFGQKAYLVFDATFTHFVGFDFNGKTTVEGFRRESVDPKRQPPEAKDQ